MPQLGEIKRGFDIGRGSRDWKNGRYGFEEYIWHACGGCGEERWVKFRRKSGVSHTICRKCAAKRRAARGYPAGPESKSWKGGKFKNPYGYIRVWLHPGNFFYPMVNKHSYVLEHRLVMAQQLGRCLHSWEIVHHKGIRYGGIENKSDNLIDNLEITTNGEHLREHSRGYRDGYKKGFADGKSSKIKQLESSIKELESQYA